MGRPKKLYMVLDTETTYPYFGRDLTHNDAEKCKKLGIARPLVYDLSWVICDSNGAIQSRKAFVIAEIYYNLPMMQQAYYANKRPIYDQRIATGEIKLVTWAQATAELIKDMQNVSAMGGYNAAFDFFKAIPYTELYINKMYLPKNSFDTWLNHQYDICKAIVNDPARPTHGNEAYDTPDKFKFRGMTYELFDLWMMSCSTILNTRAYRQFCLDNNLFTASGEYFKTSAEAVHRFITKDNAFEEAHTGVDDAIIEAGILGYINRAHAKNWMKGVTAFPFRELGTTDDYVNTHPNDTEENIRTVMNAMNTYLATCKPGGYKTKIETKVGNLQIAISTT